VSREAWFLSYGLLGLTQNGLVPILLPLAAQNGATAGFGYAAFALSGLLAPVLGGWADRFGRHRDLLVWGSAGAALCLLLFAVVDNAMLRLVLDAGAGLGTMAATTAGNVLAIQGHPEPEWDDRVARLQRFISAGQVVGLIAAGALAGRHSVAGFLCAGTALAAGAALGWSSAPPGQQRARHDKPPARPLVGGEAGVPSPQHHAHHVGWSQLAAFLSVINRTLRRFLIIWLIAYPAMNGIAVLFPVVMTEQFHMAAILPSTAYAVGVGVSLLLYAPASAATHRQGGGCVLMAGFAARLVLFAALAAFGLLRAGWAGRLVLIVFALIQFVWPLLSVAANSLSVRLAPTARGESVGLFNAATSLASSVGSALAGVIFGFYGFSALAAVTFISVAVALALAAVWLPGRPKGAPVVTAEA
jgi:MFS family permease